MFALMQAKYQFVKNEHLYYIDWTISNSDGGLLSFQFRSKIIFFAMLN